MLQQQSARKSVAAIPNSRRQVRPAKFVLGKLGLLPVARQWKVLLVDWLVPPGFMRFPTFGPAPNRLLARTSDYFRYATVGLAVQRILLENIHGSFAEVGVYRGDLSRFVHQLAPERTYYLFDTFTGFPTKDLETSVLEDDRFTDTSVEEVLKNIGDSRNIVIKQGYVPDTLEGLEEEFAFVLLDLDLYNPTMSSLQFFYPRLTQGAYLAVHDYNNTESNWACKRAVDEFMRDKPEKIIEIADEYGTVLFRKL